MKRPTENFATPLDTCWFDEHRILHCAGKAETRSVENYKLLCKLYARLSKEGSEKLKVILYFTRNELPSKEARKFMNEQFSKYIVALAIVSDTTLGRELGKSTRILLNAAYPIRICNNAGEAVTWLKTM